MSRRTSEANKAVAAAWEYEKQLVLEGKGTRNWTHEQQNQILNKGKVYDEGGKAFEGHHMKSVESYPEHQAEPANIQFLSRTEHLDAHFGSTQNPTNGYYDPRTGKTAEFPEGSYEPCKIIELSEPIIKYSDNSEAIVESEKAQKPNSAESDNKNNDTLESRPKLWKSNSSDGIEISQKASSKISTRRSIGFIDKVAKTLGFSSGADLRRAAISKIPHLIALATPIVLDVVLSSKDRNNTRESTSSYSDEGTDDKIAFESKSPIANDAGRSSPTKHMVNTKGQHYNTKDGRIWKRF